MMIRLNHIHKSYGRHVILNDFNLEIPPQERVGFIGNSGIGKTTILNIIAGLVKPDSGQMEINSGRIGYIFQEARLIPWLNVIHNVTIGAKAIGIPKPEALEKCRSILERLEIGNYESFYPGQLSGGIAQRVSIARAFFIDPEILLMDEPFNSLDPALRNRLHEYVLELTREKNITMLYVSHFPDDVIKVTNKVYLLKKEGRLLTISKNRPDFPEEQAYLSYLHSLYEDIR
jgi:NitT/TauT family transport system ATP-binding protein